MAQETSISTMRWLEGVPDEALRTTFTTKAGNFLLRCMTPDDYPAVRELLPGVSRCQATLDKPLVADLLRLPTYKAFCCFPLQREGETETTGPLCGFVELYILPHLGRASDGRLERLVVEPSQRSLGIGGAICDAVIRIAKEKLDLGRIDLTVEKPEARHLYTKLNFQPVATETMRLFL